MAAGDTDRDWEPLPKGLLGDKENLTSADSPAPSCDNCEDCSKLL